MGDINTHKQTELSVGSRLLCQQTKHKPIALWLTGLSGAGKSTIATLVQQHLYELNIHTYILDGDIVRAGLCADLGFTDTDRKENIRRVVEVTKLMLDAGLFVIVALISPYSAERFAARKSIGKNRFHEVYIDTPLGIAESRDVKGLYKKARAGEIKYFTGIDSPYEVPEAPELVVSSINETPKQSAYQIIKYLKGKNII